LKKPFLLFLTSLASFKGYFKGRDVYYAESSI